MDIILEALRWKRAVQGHAQMPKVCKPVSVRPSQRSVTKPSDCNAFRQVKTALTREKRNVASFRADVATFRTDVAFVGHGPRHARSFCVQQAPPDSTTQVAPSTTPNSTMPVPPVESPPTTFKTRALYFALGIVAPVVASVGAAPPWQRSRKRSWLPVRVRARRPRRRASPCR